ncbi:MAG: 4-(cytidine 5'-diphospho)-2-C-methyl-D-erythritol kinase [Spirochaetaceae bacterium]|jgi:4-diphosphocytidyl-2-C-methyl-D-erythritol kinase|nr:4-(cytidine 5'-diphospho)-2-C-methyl-D-erythritol kinase [Spirochaetaceae bacterium]
MIFDAPCKINLHLAIQGKREDGFHALESLFIALDLRDTLDLKQCAEGNSAFCPGKDGESGASICRIETDSSDLPEEFASVFYNLPEEKNIIYKAVKIFREKIGALYPTKTFSPEVEKTLKTVFYPLKITVKKRIPPGAGLGGGSSDAAATLRALNTLSGEALDHQTLCTAAAEIGSDVPFFLSGSAAYITGRGENSTTIPCPDISVVLVNPLFLSDTARAYRLLDNFRAADKSALEPMKGRVLLSERLSQLDSPDFALHDIAQKNEYFKNDFLPVFLTQGTDTEKTTYKAMLSDLNDLGADFAGLSGSGSTCFGIFKNRYRAENAALKLQKKWCFVRLTKPYP